MALGEDASGTLSVTGGSDQDLQAASTEDGVYVLRLDLNDMVLGDILEIAAWEMPISGGTTRQQWRFVYENVQVDKAPELPPLTGLHGWKFTAKCVAGGTISLPWSIRQMT